MSNYPTIDAKAGRQIAVTVTKDCQVSVAAYDGSSPPKCVYETNAITLAGAEKAQFNLVLSNQATTAVGGGGADDWLKAYYPAVVFLLGSAFPYGDEPVKPVGGTASFIPRSLAYTFEGNGRLTLKSADPSQMTMTQQIGGKGSIPKNHRIVLRLLNPGDGHVEFTLPAGQQFTAKSGALPAGGLKFD